VHLLKTAVEKIHPAVLVNGSHVPSVTYEGYIKLIKKIKL